MIIDIITNKAKLEKIVQDLKKKYTIQNPKSKAEAFKPIPANAKNIINDITEAIKFIGCLVELNNDYAKEHKKNEIMLTKQAVKIGIQEAEIKKLKRINERLLKNVKI
tara:strand:- start:195 stop:518 length:324 start_codon:yes stop_codon:yes gene_type:complete